MQSLDCYQSRIYRIFFCLDAREKSAQHRASSKECSSNDVTGLGSILGKAGPILIAEQTGSS